MISEDLARRIGAGEVSAITELMHLTIQETLKALPIINENLVKRSAFLQQKSIEFYEQNPELVQHKPVVADVIQRIEAENPGMDFENILSRAKVDTKKALELKGKISANGGVGGNNLKNLDDVVGIL